MSRHSCGPVCFHASHREASNLVADAGGRPLRFHRRDRVRRLDRARAPAVGADLLARCKRESSRGGSRSIQPWPEQEKESRASSVSQSIRELSVFDAQCAIRILSNACQKVLTEKKGRQPAGRSPKVSASCSSDQLTLIPRRNSMFVLVFLSLPSTSSIASTGGTPVSARRRMTTRSCSCGW